MCVGARAEHDRALIARARVPRYAHSVGAVLHWIVANPAETAWIAFLALSALVGAYQTQEVKIHAYVKRTRNTADDKFVGALDALVSVFGVLRLIVPGILGRRVPPELALEPTSGEQPVEPVEPVEPAAPEEPKP